MVSPAFGGTAPTRRTEPLKAGALCPLGLADAAFTHRKTTYFLTNKQTLEHRQKDKRQDADNVCEVNGYATVETVMWRNVRGQSVQRVHSLRRTPKLQVGGGGKEYMCVCVQASAAPSAVTNRCFVTITSSLFKPITGRKPGQVIGNYIQPSRSVSDLKVKGLQ